MPKLSKPPFTPEASYIEKAKEVVLANLLLDSAKANLRRLRQETASAMHGVSVADFEFVLAGKELSASLERPKGQRINIRKLYTLLSSNEISLEEFFDCIEAPLLNVQETLGTERAAFLTETYQKGLDLVIKEI